MPLTAKELSDLSGRFGDVDFMIDEMEAEFVNLHLLFAGGRTAYIAYLYDDDYDTIKKDFANELGVVELGAVGTMIYSRAAIAKSKARQNDLDVILRAANFQDAEVLAATDRLTGTFRRSAEPGAVPAGVVTLYALTSSLPLDDDANEIYKRNGTLDIGPPVSRWDIASAFYDEGQLRDAMKHVKRLAADASYALPRATPLGGICIAGYHVEAA